MEKDNEIEVDLQDVYNIINNPSFSQFLLLNTANWTSAAWIIQTLLDAFEEASQQLEIK